MQADSTAAARVSEADLLKVHDTLQLMLLEYGNVHIKTLGQLLRITRNAEDEYSRICIRRCRG